MAQSFTVKEDEPIVWKAYWDPTGTNSMSLIGGFAPSCTFEGRPLFEIDLYSEAVNNGGANIKVSEVSSGNGPEAIMDAGGNISGATFSPIGGNYGGSSIYSGINLPSDMTASSKPIPGTTYTWQRDGAWQGGMGVWQMADEGFQVIWNLAVTQEMSSG